MPLTPTEVHTLLAWLLCNQLSASTHLNTRHDKAEVDLSYPNRSRLLTVSAVVIYVGVTAWHRFVKKTAQRCSRREVGNPKGLVQILEQQACRGQ